MKDSNSWIERNIEKMMNQIMLDARHQKPLPLGITLHPIAYKKFVEILRSKNAYFPDDYGNFKFISVPVHINSNIPYGCFTVERFSPKVGLLK